MFFCILKDQRETLWRSSPQLEGFLDVDGRLVTQCHTRDELIFDVVFQHVFNVFDFTAAKFQWRPLLLSFGLAHNAHGTQQWSQPWHRHQPPQLVPWAALLPRDLDELTEKKRNEEILKRFWKELKRKNEKFCKKKVQQRCRPPAAASASALSAAALALRASEHRAQWSNSLGLSTFNSLTMFNS